MFPQFKNRNNESGIVLFIVLMTAIIIMIFSVSILNQSLNEVNYGQQQIDQIATDQLAKGMFWLAYSSSTGMPSGGSTLNLVLPYSQTNNRQYDVNMVQLAPVPGGYSYNIVANYDSF